MINEDANECDKAGVGFTAFVEQPDRCGRVRGTCLKNQPLAYWRRDMVRMTSAINAVMLKPACPRVAFQFHVHVRAVLPAHYVKRRPTMT